MSYSQNDEERVILELLKDLPPARFLDIGAHDGVHLSNTRALFERKWTGTLVEPSPAPFLALMETYRGVEGMDLVHVAVVPPPATLLKFYDSRGDFVSTSDEKHREVWSKDVKFQPIYVSGMTVADLLSAFPGPYTFINLDVEGMNYEVFRNLPLLELHAKVVCVEYQDKLDAIDAYAVPLGYKRVHTTGENAIYALSL